MSNQYSMNRRSFLKFSGFLTAGFVLGISSEVSASVDNISSFRPNLFLNITKDQVIEIVCHRSEMGQGTRTAIVSLIAEELEVSLDQITIVQATGDKKYGDQNTDGSRSIRYNWERLRKLGAITKKMFLQAASQHFSCQESQLVCNQAQVNYPSKSKSVSYFDLLDIVRTLAIPKDAPLKDDKDFKIIGKSQLLKDVPDMVSGKAVFGMDVEVEGMVYAALLRCPNPHGKLKTYYPSKAKKVKGIEDVFALEAIKQPINTDASVCVVGSSTYACFKAVKELQVKWDLDGYDHVTTDSFRKDLEIALAKPTKVFIDKKGKNPKEVQETFTRKYFTPFQIHAPMEPMVAVAHVKEKSCELWVPTQDPQRLRKSVAAVLKIPLESITINVTFLGGGFGRKSQPDFAIEAVLASKRVNKPVKLVWRREDDIKHGFYHTSSLQEISVGLDQKGMPLTWDHKSVFPTIMSVFVPGANTPADWEIGFGASNLPYDIAQVKVSTGEVKNPLKIGWKRAVCNIFHSFSINCLMDELATKAKIDPFDYRLKLLEPQAEIESAESSASYKNSRLIHVIKRLRDFSDWDQKKKSGKKIGFACHNSFSSHVASTVEVEGDSLKNLKITNIHIVIDLGHYVNPDSVKAQMEGSAIFALSLSLYGKIDLENGAVVQSNFDDFKMLRHDESPNIFIEVINSKESPGGAGEPGVPAVVPAIINAIYQATGQRHLELPL
ncbi:molybdopterin-dependent oxidoreductase, partial [bacterium]|nr:molybdopterin-dependent oxidoreductase [bacterium]